MTSTIKQKRELVDGLVKEHKMTRATSSGKGDARRGNDAASRKRFAEGWEYIERQKAKRKRRRNG